MKKTGILILSLIFVSALPGYFACSNTTKKKQITIDTCTALIPGPHGYVNDFDKSFDTTEIKILDSIIRAHEQTTGNQIAIVTVDSAMLGNCSLFDYSLKLGRQWGVGQKEKNNGVVIALCFPLRKITIQNGYGIVKILSNEETQKIIDNEMIPFFRKGELFQGTKAGLLSIIEKIK